MSLLFSKISSFDYYYLLPKDNFNNVSDITNHNLIELRAIISKFICSIFNQLSIRAQFTCATIPKYPKIIELILTIEKGNSCKNNHLYNMSVK